MNRRRIKKAFAKLHHSRPLTRRELAVVATKLASRQWQRYVTPKQIAIDDDLVQQLLRAFQTPELNVLRETVVQAILEGQVGPRREALNRYLDTAEGEVDKLPDTDNARTFGQIGLIYGQALIWQDAEEPVSCLRHFLDVETYCDNLAAALARTTSGLQKDWRQIVGLKLMTLLVRQRLKSFWSSAYLMWAQGDHDSAIQALSLAMQDQWRSEGDRAILKLRLVQCSLDESYDEGGPSTSQRNEWVQLLEEALSPLVAEPAQKKILGLLDEIRS